jgi:butyrate kinase
MSTDNPVSSDAAQDSSAPAVERVSDLVLMAGALRPKTVIIAGGDREEDLRLVESARDHGVVDRCVLVGDGDAIRRAAANVGITVPGEDVIATASQAETAARTVEAVQQGGADVILKGNISTPILNRAMMRLVVRNTMSLVTMFDTAVVAGGRPMLLTDPGVTTVCNFGRMVGLIENALDVARSVMQIERPRVALLSANEKVIDSLPSTGLARALSTRNWGDAHVYGPLSFDLAVSRRSVDLKGSALSAQALEVAGRADVLVCPNIEAANVLYKLIMETVEYGLGTFAGITVGVAVPYVILSRADNVEAKLQSVALCSIATDRMEVYRTGVKSTQVRAPVSGKPARILVVNPGSTSIKVALFEDDRCAEIEEFAAPPEIAAASGDAEGLLPTVDEFLEKHGVKELDAVVGRGGFLPRRDAKLPAGTYVVAEAEDGDVKVDDGIVRAMVERAELPHASNYGIPLAAALARRFGVPAFTVDPVVADDFSPEAEVSGYAGITRRSVAHVLSVRATARRAAERSGTPIEKTNYVVAHMGGGITVAAVRGGRIVDDTIALLGEGPFTPRRVGTLPMCELIDLCYSGRFTRDELVEELTQRGGLVSYLGEHDMLKIEERIEAGDEQAALVVDAMAHQIAKAIGGMCVSAGSDTEAIVLTGGLARSKRVVTALKRRLTHLYPVLVLKDTPEMQALAEGACRVLRGEEEPIRWSDVAGEAGTEG